MRKIMFTVIAFAILGSLPPTDAGAIPAFARRYKLSCNTCHDPFPRLKPFGDEFAANGFMLPESDKDRDFISAGDPLLRVNRTFPLAARMNAYVIYDEEDDSARWDLQTPWRLKLLSGGSVTRNVGYYFYFFMSEAGEVSGIEDAYLHFNNLLDQPLDILVGQFQVCDPMMKRELRLTYEDYEIYRLRVGDSRTNLTYDRGVVMAYDINATGTGLVATVVNGNGKPEAIGEDYDQDDYKNWAARLNQNLAGVASVGGFYYDGRETLDFGDNEVTYKGVDATLNVDRFGFTGQYLVRNDSRPLDSVRDAETTGWVAELVFAPDRDRSRHYWTLLYNNIDSDVDVDDYEAITGGVTYLAARNLRLNLEYTRVITDGRGDNDRNRASFGLVTAF